MKSYNRSNSFRLWRDSEECARARAGHRLTASENCHFLPCRGASAMRKPRLKTGRMVMISRKTFAAALSASVLASGFAHAADACSAGSIQPRVRQQRRSNIPPKRDPTRSPWSTAMSATTGESPRSRPPRPGARVPDNAKKLSEFKIISVGNNSTAQIAAIDNFIAAGYDGIVINAVNPDRLRCCGQARQACRHGAGDL